ncbi:unnamed protein product [Lampetra fluviatilis]
MMKLMMMKTSDIQRHSPIRSREPSIPTLCGQSTALEGWMIAERASPAGHRSDHPPRLEAVQQQQPREGRSGLKWRLLTPSSWCLGLGGGFAQCCCCCCRAM